MTANMFLKALVLEETKHMMWRKTASSVLMVPLVDSILSQPCMYHSGNFHVYCVLSSDVFSVHFSPSFLENITYCVSRDACIRATSATITSHSFSRFVRHGLPFSHRVGLYMMSEFVPSLIVRRSRHLTSKVMITWIS